MADNLSNAGSASMSMSSFSSSSDNESSNEQVRKSSSRKPSSAAVQRILTAENDNAPHEQPTNEEHQRPEDSSLADAGYEGDEDSGAEAEDDKRLMPSSPLSNADKNASKTPAAPLRDQEASESEYDSEDIIIPPRSSRIIPPRSSRPAPAEAAEDFSSSGLPSIGATPEPPDPELESLERKQKCRELAICECERCCACEKYKLFYGDADGEGEDGFPDQKHLNERGLAAEVFPESAIRSTIKPVKREVCDSE